MIRSDQSLSHVQLFATPWIAAHQASLSITNSWSSLRLKSIESVMPSSHLILCRPLLLLPPIPPSIRVFSNESTLRMRWPKYWSFSFSIIPSKEIPGLISFRMDWLLSMNWCAIRMIKRLIRIYKNVCILFNLLINLKLLLLLVIFMGYYLCAKTVWITSHVLILLIFSKSHWIRIFHMKHEKREVWEGIL